MGVLGSEGQKGRKYRNRKHVTICGHPGCQTRLWRGNQTGLCRSHFLENLHKDKWWDAQNKIARTEGVVKMHADPDFKKKFSEKISKDLKAFNQTDEGKAAALKRGAAISRKFKNDPEFMDKHKERMRRQHKLKNKEKSDAP